MFFYKLDNNLESPWLDIVCKDKDRLLEDIIVESLPETEKRVIKLKIDKIFGELESKLPDGFEEIDIDDKKKEFKRKVSEMSSNARLENLIEALCVYYYMEHHRKEVDEFDKFRMHKKEGKSAASGGVKGLFLGTVAGGAILADALATGGLMTAILSTAGGVAGGLIGGMGAAASSLDNYRSDQANNRYKTALKLARNNIVRLVNIIQNSIVELIRENNRFVYKNGMMLLIEDPGATKARISKIERKDLEDLLVSNNILGYSTGDAKKRKATISRIASLLKAELDIEVKGVDTSEKYNHNNSMISATTDRDAKVGKPANNNIEELFKSIAPSMSGDLINNPLTLLMMMNRGGGDIASLMLMLMMALLELMEVMLIQAKQLMQQTIL